MSQRCLVVYHHLPHYRFAVFKALESDNDYAFHFAAGTHSRDNSIPVLDSRHLTSVHALRNRWLGPFLWQRGILRLVREPWDKVVFLGDAAFLSTWAAAAYLRLRGTPVGFWTIGWHRRESRFREWFRSTFYRLANRLYLYGDVGRDIGIEAGFPADRMGVIYNSSGGPSDRSETVTPQAPQVSPQVIGAVIRLNPVKRLDLLIHAVAAIRETGNLITVAILGEGPDRKRLEQLSRELHVPLELPGAEYDSTRIQRFYDRIAVTVVPSVAGLSVTQSLRFGRPVVTHGDMYEQAPECEAIVEGATGSLYERDNVQALAKAIAFWLERQQYAWEATSSDCHEEVRRRWTGQAQARALSRELAQTYSRRTPRRLSRSRISTRDDDEVAKGG